MKQMCAIAACCLMALGATGCGQAQNSAAERSEELPPVQEAREASSEDWINAADRLQSEKEELERTGPLADGAAPDELQNSADANYLSEPVDVTGPGGYVLVFRDVLSEHLDLGYSVLPPSDVDFAYQIGSVRVDKVSATIEIEMTVADGDIDRPYQGFRVWIA